MDRNTPSVKRPRIKNSSDTEPRTFLAYEVVGADIMEIVDGQKSKLPANPSRQDKGKSKHKKQDNINIGEALRVMQSYGYPINTPEERRVALNDFHKINKRARKKGKAPLVKRESSSYASISREQFPKAGSGLKVVSGGVETNRRMH